MHLLIIGQFYTRCIWWCVRNIDDDSSAEVAYCKEHETLPYPEGTACAHVLIAGEKGGDFAKAAFQGLGFAMVYAVLQKVFHVIAELPSWGTAQVNKFFLLL